MDIGWAQELLGRRGTLDSISLRLTKRSDPQKVAAELRRAPAAGCDGRAARPTRRTGGKNARRFSTQPPGDEPGLAPRRDVPDLQHGRGFGHSPAHGDRDFAFVRRKPAGGARAFPGRGRSARRGRDRARDGRRLFARPRLVGTVAETISSLYVLLSVREMVVAPWIWASALLLGLVSVLAAAWLPARAAAAMDPVETLHHGARIEKAVKLSRGWILGGVISLLLCARLLGPRLADRPALAWIRRGLFCSRRFFFLAPELTARFSRLMRATIRGKIAPALAAQNLGRTLLRNSVTIASLAAAVAMTVGVAVMVFSFRQTVGDWIGQTLVADLFIGPAANEIAGPTSFVPPAAIEYLKRNPQVEEVDTYRGVELPFRDQTIGVAVITGHNRRNLRFLRGSNDEIIRRFYSEQCVLISESFARRFHVAEGETLQVADAGRDEGFSDRRGFLRLHERPGHRLSEREEFPKILARRSRQQHRALPETKGGARGRSRRIFASTLAEAANSRSTRIACFAPASSRFSIRRLRSPTFCARSRCSWRSSGFFSA